MIWDTHDHGHVRGGILFFVWQDHAYNIKMTVKCVLKMVRQRKESDMNGFPQQSPGKQKENDGIKMDIDFFPLKHIH